MFCVHFDQQSKFNYNLYFTIAETKAKK